MSLNRFLNHVTHFNSRNVIHRCDKRNMFSSPYAIAFLFLGFLFVTFRLIYYIMYINNYSCCTRKPVSEQRSQQDDIWNISGRVNQGQSLPSNRWPTHDHHIPVESFVISDRLSKNVPPPPPYSEVDLPSYEEATGCSGKNDIVPVHSTPQTSTNTR